MARLLLIGSVLLLLVMAVPSRPALAQETEPTATPTPAWQQAVTLSSGNTLLIERRITYGEISIFGAILLVGVLIFFYIALKVPKTWI